jgi:DNA gyrase subunit A
MEQFAREVTPINIEEELKNSYLDYAMSVIVGRALPDVRDGLKPVHRRSLFAMRELGNDWNKPYKKSARIVGDVIGKYHPHGDTAVYDTLVRMAQSFSMRYLLVDGQGNFGSVDGDSPAAMRYTEVRLSQFAHALMDDLDKETVDFVSNYDETEMIPHVFPTRIPNLLVNGSSGIAVGMATNIPPHNLTEVINACLVLIDQPELELTELIKLIPGPDFPTSGIIYGRSGILSAYQTGRGSVVIRAKTEIETNEKTGKDSIIVTELPYQVNKARLIEKIAELVKDKKIEGITELRDESDKDGMRIVIEVRKGEMTDVLLNNLFLQTQMQNSFGINMVALVDGQPKTLNIKQILTAFIEHRQEVVTRRTLFELRKARDRAHLLEGLGVSLNNIDEIIALIKASREPATAKAALLAKVWNPGTVLALLQKTGTDIARPEGLVAEYGLQNEREYRLSEAQVDAILELRLQRLTGLEQDKIFAEYEKILSEIIELLNILGNVSRLFEVIREDLIAVRDQFGDERRTQITDAAGDIDIEDLIPEEDRVVTLSSEGYIKSQPVSSYEAQRRGGRGKAATALKEEDYVEKLVVASSHDYLLCFSNLGQLYWAKVYTLPQAGRNSRGRPINNLLPLQENEKITALLGVRHFDDEHFVFMATEQGVVKKTALSAFSRPRTNGIRAVELDEGDQLIGVAITDGARETMLFSNEGKAVRFNEKDVRVMGRGARGVRGMTLKPGQKVVSLIVVEDESIDILTATENGYGKRTAVTEYRLSGRGAQGVMSIQTSARNGLVVAAIPVITIDEIMLITSGGVLVRTRAGEISQIGRTTQGVRLINLGEGEKLVSVERVDPLEAAELEGEVLSGETEPTAE